MWKESPLSLDPWSLSTRSPVFTGDVAANVNGAGSLGAQLAKDSSQTPGWEAPFLPSSCHPNFLHLFKLAERGGAGNDILK